MNINSDKPWLKNYPEGVSSNINFDEYSSLVDMFEKTCNRFSSNKAFTNFGVSLTFKDIFYDNNKLILAFVNIYECSFSNIHILFFHRDLVTHYIPTFYT